MEVAMYLLCHMDPANHWVVQAVGLSRIQHTTENLPLCFALPDASRLSEHDVTSWVGLCARCDFRPPDVSFSPGARVY